MTDPKEKTKVLIAVPMRRFNPETAATDLPKHLQALIALLASSPDLPWALEMMTFGGGNVARGRNKIVASFLRGSWKWITFCDDDIFPDEDDPEKLAESMAQSLFRILGHRLHVCGGLYTTKSEDRCHWVLNTYQEPEIDANGLLPVPELGTGGMKTYHRTVFEHLIQKEADLAYVCDESRAPEWGFFCQGLMTVDGKRRWLPEDYWMDQLCRKHGIPVYVDTTVRFRHLDATDGKTYPLGGDWPALPGPHKAPTPPPLVEDMAFQWDEKASSPSISLLICLQFWEGDKKAAMKLARYIADLEPAYRDDLEMRFVYRHDTAMDLETQQYVSGRMRTSTREVPRHEVGYPQSPNFMAMDTIRDVASRDDVFGVMLMESDCIPVSSDWINQLLSEWAKAKANGKLVMGSWRAECSDWGHINGNLFFSPKLAEMIYLPACPNKPAWDVFYPRYFNPVWCRTGLIANRYFELAVSDEAMRTPECGLYPPCLIHGIKDTTAVQYSERMTGVKFQ